MRIALISDVHANGYALEAVDIALKKLRPTVDEVWFLGDIVGYGPHPAGCVEWLLASVNPEVSLPGNHEALVYGYDYPLNPDAKHGDAAKVAAAHHRTQLAEAGLLERLHEHCNVSQYEERMLRRDGFNWVLKHCSLAENFRYIQPWKELYIDVEIQHLRDLSERLSLTNRPTIMAYGHTHVPTLIYGSSSLEKNIVRVEYDCEYEISRDYTIINPGSVGQPRNLSFCASYAVLTVNGKANSVVFKKVKYDVNETITDVSAMPLPPEDVRELSKYLTHPKLDDHATNDWREHLRSVSDC